MCAPGTWTARAAVRAARAEAIVAAASAEAAAVTRAEKARGMAVWHSERRMLAAAFRQWYERRRWMPHWTRRVRRQRHLHGAAMVRAEERVHALSLRIKLHAREVFIGWREAAQTAAKAAKRAARTLVWRTGRVQLKLTFLRWRSAAKASAVPPPLDGNLAGAGYRCVTKTDCAGASHDCATRTATSAPPSGQSARPGRRERVGRGHAVGAAEAAPARASGHPIPRAFEVEEKAPLMSEPERHRAGAAALATKLACQLAADEKLASKLRRANLARRRAEAAAQQAAEAAAQRSAEAATHELASRLALQCAEAPARQGAEAAALDAELARRRPAEEENEAAHAAARSKAVMSKGGGLTRKAARARSAAESAAWSTAWSTAEVAETGHHRRGNTVKLAYYLPYHIIDTYFASPATEAFLACVTCAHVAYVVFVARVAHVACMAYVVPEQSVALSVVGASELTQQRAEQAALAPELKRRRAEEAALARPAAAEAAQARCGARADRSSGGARRKRPSRGHRTLAAQHQMRARVVLFTLLQTVMRTPSQQQTKPQCRASAVRTPRRQQTKPLCSVVSASAEAACARLAAGLHLNAAAERAGAGGGGGWLPLAAAALRLKAAPEGVQEVELDQEAGDADARFEAWYMAAFIEPHHEPHRRARTGTGGAGTGGGGRGVGTGGADSGGPCSSPSLLPRISPNLSLRSSPSLSPRNRPSLRTPTAT